MQLKNVIHFRGGRVGAASSCSEGPLASQLMKANLRKTAVVKAQSNLLSLFLGIMEMFLIENILNVDVNTQHLLSW